MPYAEDIGIRSGRRPRKRKPYTRPAPQARPGPVTPSEQRTVKRYERRQRPVDPYTQLKRAGALTPTGGQRRQGPRFGPGRPEVMRIVPAVKDAEGRVLHPTRLIPHRRYVRLLAEALQTIKQREQYARQRGYPGWTAYAQGAAASPLDPEGITAAKPSTAFGRLTADVGRRAFAGNNLRVVTAPYHIGRAFAEDPGSTTKGTLGGVKDIIVGLPSAAVKTVTDPSGALKQLEEDLSRRWGPLARGETEEFRKRIQEEGFAAEALDLATLGAVQGRVLGAGARTTARGKEFMDKPRPTLRTSGGKARPQRLSGNAFVVAAQRGLDVAREGGSRRLGPVQVGIGRRGRAARNPERRRALDVAARPGEVVPFRPRFRQTREVAQLKSRRLQQMKAEQAREVHRGASKNIAKLNSKERKAFKYAMQLGLPADPKRAVAALKVRRAQIVEARKSEGAHVPKALLKTNDELRVIDDLIENADQAFTPRLREVADVERVRELRLAGQDPALDRKQALLRRYAPLAESLGLRREGLDELARAHTLSATVRRRAARGTVPRAELVAAQTALREARAGLESAPAFVRRVREAAEKQGRSRPAYFPSEKRPTVRFANYALGGTHAIASDKRYTGALFRTGREYGDPSVFTQGLARNIKRRHNWETVAENFGRHSFSWGRNKTVGQLLDELDRRGIDPGDVAFWNPRKYREARKGAEDVSERERTGVGEEPVPQGLPEAVDEAALTGEQALRKGGEFRNTAGFSIVPKAVYDEIHMDTRPSGKWARTADIVKGKQARILLGFANLPWIQLQIGSNVLLTGLAKTGPIDAIKAQVWWPRLRPRERDNVEPYVGIGPFTVDVQQTRLGASTNNRLVNAYRAFKQTPGMQRAGKMNPLDALFRVDNAQNNFFRRSVLYSQVKRDAYARLRKDSGLAFAMQARLTNIFKLGPEEQMRAVLKDPVAMERHAKHVNDMLGDYATYTAKERRILGRNIMFYGFLRFSLNFTFHTMPARHPIISTIAGHLGRLQTQEVRELLGGDELPFALGRLYLTKDGKLQMVDLTHANPAGNVLTEAIGDPKPIGKALSLLPPVYTTALELAFEKSAFRGRSFRVEGETGYAAAARESVGKGVGAENQARIALANGLSLFYPYRVAEDLIYGDVPQGDDALLWSPRPTVYKEPEILTSLARERARRERKGTMRLLLERLTPFVPRETRDIEVARSLRERRAEQSGKPSGGKKGVPTAREILRGMKGSAKPPSARDILGAMR